MKTLMKKPDALKSSQAD